MEIENKKQKKRNLNRYLININSLLFLRRDTFSTLKAKVNQLLNGKSIQCSAINKGYEKFNLPVAKARIEIHGDLHIFLFRFNDIFHPFIDGF